MTSVVSLMQGYGDLLERYLVALDDLLESHGGMTPSRGRGQRLERYRRDREMVVTAKQGVRRILALLEADEAQEPHRERRNL
jgi:hypothetical protein